MIDSGIDQANAEFAGRISPLSTGINGNTTFQQEDNHGTL